jgi:Mn-dependent DtxR family transcriptional regulator
LALARKKVEVSAIAERLGISGRNVNSYLRSFRAKGLLPEREAK